MCIIYLYIHVYSYAYIYIHVHAYVNVYVYRHMCMHVYIYAYISTYKKHVNVCIFSTAHPANPQKHCMHAYIFLARFVGGFIFECHLLNRHKLARHCIDTLIHFGERPFAQARSQLPPVLQCVAVQSVAVCCSAVCCNVLPLYRCPDALRRKPLCLGMDTTATCVAVRCSAVRCNVLQCVNPALIHFPQLQPCLGSAPTATCVAVCCIVLQCAAVSRSML